MDVDRYHASEFGRAGRTVGPNSYVAYFPAPIPRQLTLSNDNVSAMAEAEAALGRLAGAGRLLPNPQLMVGPYLRREALASTRIEGTQASLAEVYEAEVSEARLSPDVEEVVNYVNAMERGLLLLGELPFSVRLIREMHRVLLSGVRGWHRQPGELRTSQNWIGPSGATIETASFVPPPPGDVPGLLSDLEHFVNADGLSLPPLVQTALVHYQFETIHPFLDGNGRLGRLLVVFALMLRDRLPSPLLYISPYFEARRTDYYDALQKVREEGDIDRWMSMFFDAITVQSNDGIARAEELTDLRERNRDVVQATSRGAAVQLVELVFEQPVLTAGLVERRLGVSKPTALKALRQLADTGLLTEIEDGARRQVRWRADPVIDALTREPDLPGH
ncbi:MAG: Fic family protein [Actinobacteria bacterium]|nr:Fic family protein [Actinomycetota bacterium]MCB9390220.1 Fic family protein [Acidimicrobiia bacterium]